MATISEATPKPYVHPARRAGLLVRDLAASVGLVSNNTAAAASPATPSVAAATKTDLHPARKAGLWVRGAGTRVGNFLNQPLPIKDPLANPVSTSRYIVKKAAQPFVYAAKAPIKLTGAVLNTRIGKVGAGIAALGALGVGLSWLGGGQRFDREKVEKEELRQQPEPMMSYPQPMAYAGPQMGANTMMGLEPTPGAMAARVMAGRTGAAVQRDVPQPTPIIAPENVQNIGAAGPNERA